MICYGLRFLYTELSSGEHASLLLCSKLVSFAVGTKMTSRLSQEVLSFWPTQQSEISGLLT